MFLGVSITMEKIIQINVSLWLLGQGWGPVVPV